MGTAILQHSKINLQTSSFISDGGVKPEHRMLNFQDSETLTFTLPSNSSLKSECRILKSEGGKTLLFKLQQSPFALPLNRGLNDEYWMQKREV